MSDEITDEMIMALADGELDGAQSDAVRAAVAASPTLQARFRAYQDSRRVLAGYFDGLLDRPVPEAMKQRVLGQTNPDEGVSSLEAARARRGRLPGFDVRSQAAAAAILIGLGALGGYQVGQGQASPGALVLAGQVPPDSPLHAALSATPAGTPVDVGRAEFLAIATLQMPGGEVCREFELTREGSGAVALACRAEGGWQVEVAALTVTAQTKGQFAPASADAFEVVGSVLDAKGRYDTVDPADEACVLDTPACALRP